MRPCNQCRRPIQNAQQLCEECSAYNQQHGIPTKPIVSLKPHDPATEPRLPFYKSFNPMLIGLASCNLIFFGLLGFLLLNELGLAIGLALAGASTFTFSLMMRG